MRLRLTKVTEVAKLVPVRGIDSELLFPIGAWLRHIHNSEMRNIILGAVIAACAIVFVLMYRKEQAIERGRAAFARYGCASCHYAGGAPSLQNVGKRHDRATLTMFLQDPAAVYKARGGRPFNEKFQAMPRMKIAAEDIPNFVAYLRDLSD